MAGQRLASAVREDDLNRLFSVKLQVVRNGPLCDNIKLGISGLDIAGRDNNTSTLLVHYFHHRLVKCKFR